MVQSGNTVNNMNIQQLIEVILLSIQNTGIMQADHHSHPLPSYL
jgi:hypothetical protein